MLDYKLLEALACVIHEKGFDKASRKLNITQSAVSQRIRLLEDQAGQILVTRTTPPKATSSGKKLLTHYLKVKGLEADLVKDLGNKTESGFQVFSIGINADSLATWFLPAVQDFLKTQHTLLDLKVDDQDQTHDLLRNGEVSGCISSKNTPVQGCHVTPIGTMNYRMAATKGFVQHYFPDGLKEEQVKTSPAVIFNRKDDLHIRFFQQYFKKPISAFPIHYVPSSEQFARMVLEGIAYGMIPDLQGRDAIRSGHLVDLAPSCHIRVTLYWHCWNLSSDFLDAFSRTIVKNAMIW